MERGNGLTNAAARFAISAAKMGRTMNYVRRDALGWDPVAQAQALGPMIAAAADEVERTQALPAPLMSALHEARMARMLLPRSVGGDEIEPWVYLHTVEELARHDGSVAWNVFVANSSALIAPFLPLEAAQDVFGDPRAWVSWGPPNQFKSRAVPGGYIVDGAWDFASGSRQATWMGAHTQIIEQDGSIRLTKRGVPHVRTLLFRKEHTTPIENWNTIGMRGTASEGYRVTQLFVPEMYTGTREDPALRRDPGPLYAFTMQGLYAVGVAGVAFGIARAMLDAFMALAVEKAPRGQPRLADSAIVQAAVARREANLGSARAWLGEILREIWAGATDSEPIGPQDRARVRLGCAHGINTAVEIVDYVYKAAGTSAIFPGTPFERRFRDMHTLSQQIQSRDSHFEAVGRVMFHGDPDGVFL